MKNLLCKIWIYTNVIFISFCQNPIVDSSNSINHARSSEEQLSNVVSTNDANTGIINFKSPSKLTDIETHQVPSDIGAVNSQNISETLQYPNNNSSPSAENIIITESGQAILDLSATDLGEVGIKSNHMNIIPDGVNPIVTRKSDIENNFLNESPVRDYEALVGTDQLENSNSFVQLEKLSRNRRQTSSRTRRLNEAMRNRVLLLTNSASNDTTNPRLDGRVLMLARPHNGSSRGSARPNSMMRLKPRDSIFDILQANGQNTGNLQLSEATRSQPAIQRITDLNNIELRLTPSEFSHENSSSVSVNRHSATNNNSTDAANMLNGQRISTSQISQRPNTRSITSTNRQRSSSRQINRNQGRQSGRSQTNRQPTRQLVSLRSSQQNPSRSGTRRTTNRLSSSRSSRTNREPNAQNTRIRSNRLVQPRLTIQQPVNTRRIGSQPSNARSMSSNSRSTLSNTRSTSPNSRSTSSNTRSTSSARISNRPLVRTVSTRNVRQQPPRNRASNPRQRSNSGLRQPRRQMVRRRPSPPDPFTQRFAAGFQRGSNLLHQPPLDFSSFNGTVRENVGFNGLPDIPGIPPMPLTQTPRLFGGFPFPGFGFGPTII